MARATVALPELVVESDPRYRLERFSVDQAAAYLLVHKSRIYADAKARVLGHRRDGSHRLRFSQADLDAWRQRQRVEVLEAAPLKVVGGLPMPKVRRFS